MHDINFIREQPAEFDRLMAKRGLPEASANIRRLDELRRSRLTVLQEATTAAKTLEQEIGVLRRDGKDDEATIREGWARAARNRIRTLEAEAQAPQNALESEVLNLPNVPLDDVPEGKDESANVEIVSHLAQSRRPKGPDHVEIGERLGMMDFAAAAALSGSRFVVLKGPLARLSRALGAMMLDVHTRHHGYTEVEVPLIVNDDALYGTAQLPKFGEDLYQIAQRYEGSPDQYLIPTAEVPLTNLVANTILTDFEQPLRYTALTPCFRSEAGSAGRDTRGMLRQHQFMKCELVAITRPQDAFAEHERMLEAAETILRLLGLPYRVMKLCGGDMGFSARKTYDIEVWLPGQKAFREISSVSNCGDFQARRLKARYREGNQGKPTFVHTLNGSGVAVGRALIAVLENGLEPDGSILLPSNLWPYFGGSRIDREELAQSQGR